MKFLIPLLAALIATPTFAADQLLRLEDGRQVLLKADFTWDYVVEPSAAAAPQPDAIAVVAQPATVVSQPRGVTFSANQDKPILQTTKSDITVVLAAPHLDGDELVIPTSVINTGLESLIETDLQISISVQGGEPQQHTVKIWRAIKRMASTYLRPGKSKAGNEVRIKIEPAAQYQLEAKISHIETRS
ncbi:DUF3157 family protein [uncultured Ferrimonas sp.]|uniref:DUF3157 family protein n=1 Tax=uncultured Ferrimonas sp. TaxID=432640 RepID=UPI002633A313|nr:DUF3157 family protein [uncultured Ferrimonas sp.]